jgi:hypothetical protein
MTLRSLAMSDVFKAGVAQYGFVHARMMSLEGRFVLVMFPLVPFDHAVATVVTVVKDCNPMYYRLLIGGDFTWEQEYIGDVRWPVTPATIDSDNFHHLGEVTQPTVYHSEPPIHVPALIVGYNSCFCMERTTTSACPAPRTSHTEHCGFEAYRHNVLCTLVKVCQTHQLATRSSWRKGIGHGFDQPAHQRNRDARLLAWFLKYLPASEQRTMTL